MRVAARCAVQRAAPATIIRMSGSPVTYPRWTRLHRSFRVCQRHILLDSEGMVVTQCQVTMRRVNNWSSS